MLNILLWILEQYENNNDAYVSTNLILVRKIYLLYISPLS